MGTAVRDTVSSQKQQLGTGVRDTISSQEQQLGTAVRDTTYIITRGALGNSGKRHYIIASTAVGNNVSIQPDSLYNYKRSSWEQQ